MAKMNRAEAEVDAIHDRIYETTKHMTREEKAKRVMDSTASGGAIWFYYSTINKQ